MFPASVGNAETKVKSIFWNPTKLLYARYKSKMRSRSVCNTANSYNISKPYDSSFFITLAIHFFASKRNLEFTMKRKTVKLVLKLSP